ncbi:MAG: hemerythrin domain-containing protein, partial [Nitrosomonadales bacterium]|nr:hemerythrin domain-containing protein [Nitrosomonadales bacterium]
MHTPKHPIADEVSLVELIAIIEKSHHNFTRIEIERINVILKDDHLETLPSLEKIIRCFTKLKDDLETHLLKEERILFPYISQLERNPSVPQYSCFGSIENPIRKMQLEHIVVIGLLEELREITLQYCPLNGSNKTIVDLYEALAGLDSDLIKHIHL